MPLSNKKFCAYEVSPWNIAVHVDRRVCRYLHYQWRHLYKHKPLHSSRRAWLILHVTVGGTSWPWVLFGNIDLGDIDLVTTVKSASTSRLRSIIWMKMNARWWTSHQSLCMTHWHRDGLCLGFIYERRGILLKYMMQKDESSTQRTRHHIRSYCTISKPRAHPT